MERMPLVEKTLAAIFSLVLGVVEEEKKKKKRGQQLS
jgi:hypothetical protein